MKTFDQILVETRGRVRLVTLNRPDKLNAWTYTMSKELAEAFQGANEDKEIGAIVVTGAGRGFCAGADIEQSFASRLDGKQSKDETDRRDWVDLVRQSKPIIGAINGVAVGVGITLALPFDVLLASDKARVGMFFVKMGLVPELASSHFLVQRVGLGLASEMCLTGKLYGAEELRGTGFFNRIVPHDELVPAALELGETIAANPAPSLGMIKDLLTKNATDNDLDAVKRREMEALSRAYQTPEHRAAVESFMSKAR